MPKGLECAKSSNTEERQLKGGFVFCIATSDRGAENYHAKCPARLQNLQLAHFSYLL